VQDAKNKELRAKAEKGELPIITLDEFQKHVDADSLWISYHGEVYDITNFACEHPGGLPILIGAGGQDVEVIWNKYQIHYRRDIMSQLEPYRIGTLSESDAETLRNPKNKESAAHVRPIEFDDPTFVKAAAAKRDAARAGRRVAKVWALTLTSTFWSLTRSAVRLVGLLFPVVGPLLANKLAKHLPCAVPGYAGAAKVAAEDPVSGKRTRVAVIGGGISGCACAYSLSSAGYEVVVYESREVLGGNAQCASFPCGEGKTVSQDLSVVWFDPNYYRNYWTLMSTLGLKPSEVEIPYVIRSNMHGHDEFYTCQGLESELDKKLQPSLRDRYATDFKRYGTMLGCIKRFNWTFNWGSTRTSFYSTNSYSVLPYFNPMNYIGSKTCAKLFGMSTDFYEEILAPYHGLSMTGVNIEDLPATAYHMLEDIAPLLYAKKAYSWGVGNSQDVFKLSTQKCDVRLDTRVRQVLPESSGKDWRQTVIDDKGNAETFDRVVMACPAHAAANVVRPQNWMERTILQGITYHDDFHKCDWNDWLESPVHQDVECLPEKHRDVILEHGAFVIDIDRNGRESGGLNVEYTHNLGSWSPSARSAGVSAKDAKMFMSQSPHKHRDYSDVIKTFSAPRGHPDLSTSNMVVTQILHLIQGRRGVYYCSNWTGPGNGHDLACTTGLCAASAVGAPYPFTDPESRRDWRDCRRFMNI